jgi:hypothetical protein
MQGRPHQVAGARSQIEPIAAEDRRAPQIKKRVDRGPLAGYRSWGTSEPMTIAEHAHEHRHHTRRG